MVHGSIPINDPALLPLRGFVYGPIENQSTFRVEIKKLSCKPNMTKEESLTTNNRLLTLEDNALAHKEVDELETKLDQFVLNDTEKIEEALDRIEINENSIVQLDANITQNLANIEENEGRFKTNEENINKMNITINSNEIKITNHDGLISSNSIKITKNENEINTYHPGKKASLDLVITRSAEFPGAYPSLNTPYVVHSHLKIPFRNIRKQYFKICI